MVLIRYSSDQAFFYYFDKVVWSGLVFFRNNYYIKFIVLEFDNMLRMIHFECADKHRFVLEVLS